MHTDMTLQTQEKFYRESILTGSINLKSQEKNQLREVAKRFGVQLFYLILRLQNPFQSAASMSDQSSEVS